MNRERLPDPVAWFARRVISTCNDVSRLLREGQSVVLCASAGEHYAVLTIHPATEDAWPTRQEREIVDLIGCGLRTAQVARQLGIEPDAVRYSLRGLMDAFDLHTRAKLVRYFFAHVLEVVELESPRELVSATLRSLVDSSRRVSRHVRARGRCLLHGSDGELSAIATIHRGARPVRLAERDRPVVERLGRALTNAGIARVLHTTERRVKTAIDHAMRLTRCRTRMELVRHSEIERIFEKLS